MSSDDVKITGGAARRPKQRRMRDMVLSMAVLLVPLAIFYGAWNWAASDRQVSVVNTAEDYQAAEGLGLEAVQPVLSEDWKAISSALEAGETAVTLRTGWYSPDGHGLQLVQTTEDPALVDEELDGAGESVAAGGLEWTAYEVTDGESWVVALDGLNVIVTAEPDGVGEMSELAEGVAAGR